MKTKITLFFLLALSLVNAQVPSFATKKSLGNDMVARHGAGMVSYNNKLYIIGGYANCGPKDFTEYDPNTGALNKLKNLGSGCANPIYVKGMFIIQNKLYLLQINSITEYNFQTDSWGSPISVSVGTASVDAAFVVNNIIYVSTTQNDLVSYNPINGQIAQKADYPGPANRRGAFAFAIGNKGYLGAGTTAPFNNCTANEAGCFRNEFYEYDTLTDIWTVKANLPTAFFEGVGASINGKGYAGTGRSFISSFIDYRSSFWYEYDPLTNVWTSKQNFMNTPNPPNTNNSGKQASSIATIGDDIFLFGGITSNVSLYDDSVHKYNTTTNTWSIIDVEVGKNRTEASGFFLNGKAYVGGGEDNEGINDFWEYDPATNNWLQKANLPTIHTQRAAAEVAGKGYVVGGYSRFIQSTGTNPEFLDALVEYNPITNAWTNKAPYPAGKRRGMIAMSYNGKFFAGQGSGINGIQTDGFYEYNPLTNSWTQKTNVPFIGAFCSSFVIGNIGYVVSFSPQKLVGKYNFDTNTWTTEAHSLNTNNTSSGHPNQNVFTFNGFGYLVHNGGVLSKYNPTTSSWSQVTNLSFANQGQNLIPAGNGVYFGFGNTGVSHPLGLAQVNDWRFLKFDAAVSDKFGVYSTRYNIASSGISAEPVQCGTGNLTTNATHSVFDSDGDLFSAVLAGTGSLPSACYSISSINLATPFKTETRNFGNSIVETGMYLNKSVFFPGSQSFGGSEGTFRLYYTTTELNKLVTDFNALYGTNKTLADIKIVRYQDQNNSPTGHDANPLNNTNGNYTIYNTTIANYGADKFYDINFEFTTSVNGEIYAVLLAGQNLTNVPFVKANPTIYPNPASSILNIQTEQSILDLKIVDIAGRATAVRTTANNSVDVSDLSNGIYFIEIRTNEGLFKEKFIKN
ncbi:kelch repeat-containing protein [Flavobacterium sp.]|jgi:hypothetical protein|uniref:Kelch repeat-containing protein n=1 Tax=Flavobacterium sp. TaxID=239 RepID=UPI0037C08CA0